MDLKLKYLMGKQVLRKAYTLLEVLIMILFISVFLLYSYSDEYLKVLYIKTLIEKIQIESFVDEKKIEIEINNNILKANERSYILNLNCDYQNFHFNEYGNVSNGLTLKCGKYKIVIQLGSGSIEIR